MNDTIANSTESHGLQNPALDGAFIVLSIFILIINSIVIYLFFSREYLQTKTNSLLVSLAVSDLMVGLLGIPLNIACNAVTVYRDQVCYAAALTYRLQAVSEMAHIFVTTIERYIYVMYPMKYIRIVTAPRILKVMGSVWCFSIFVAFIQFAWNNPNEILGMPTPTRMVYDAVYNIFGALVCFLLPLIVMIISYSRLFVVIHRQIKEIHLQNYPRSGSGSQRAPVATEARAISIFALMLSIFTLAWSSWYIMSFSFFFGFYQHLSDHLLDFLDFFRFSVAFINPILYTFLKRDFARAFKSLVMREGVRPREFVTSTRLKSRGFASTSMQTRMSNSYGDENPITANGNTA
ncbi:octopamine receptor-like [Actinia tenebrosa]|uniref:Octopamine receptor-like n=1 Tax=Actinia tenebrosa TaxID=6105 RepID=A0A6P8I3X3_ACTTE|nr:octopamine receptor-like [Actinia tenebrosa]